MRSFFFILLFPTLTVAQKPNIIYIMSDDHDADAISAYNKTLTHTPNIDRIAKEGMRFTHCFVGNSICGPARATLLTGQHSHKNGMKDNRTRFDSSKITMPKLMQLAGYETAIVGKWHLHSYPTGFDHWLILPGQGLYFDPRLINQDGDTSVHRGYATDIITDEAIKWMDHRDLSKPFLLLLHHKAPHRYFFAPLRFIRLFHNMTFPEPATLYASMENKGTAWRNQTMSILNDMKLSSDLKVDPEYLMNIPRLKPDSAEISYYHAVMNRIPRADREIIKQIYAERGKILQLQRPSGKALLKLKYQWYMQDYLACVASVDENIGRLLDHLDSTGLSKNTIVIYTSDQGMYLGENGWFDKRFMYDVSMQTPFLIRWPGKIKPATVTNTMAQNIDFAPTFLDMAGVKIPEWMQGISLLPLVTGKQKEFNRSALYYHFYEYKADHTVLPHYGVREKRYKVIYFYTVGEWELYDLDKDPSEQNNLINVKAYAKTLERMKGVLKDRRRFYDDQE